MMVLKGAALEPMAELRKFTASLATPTIKSATAKNANTATANHKKPSIFSGLFYM
jgi:hypothetical protein